MLRVKHTQPDRRVNKRKFCFVRKKQTHGTDLSPWELLLRIDPTPLQYAWGSAALGNPEQLNEGGALPTETQHRQGFKRVGSVMTLCVSQMMDRGGWVPVIADVNTTVHRNCSKCIARWRKQNACADAFPAFFPPRSMDQVWKL